MDIQKVIDETKIGDVLVIRTEKADRENNLEEDNVRHKSGAIRHAKVIDKCSKRFCMVEFDNGVKESIMWVDIVRYRRGKTKCVN